MSSAHALIKSSPIDSVSVVGAGVMGRGIAAANLRHQIPVVLTDSFEASLRAGVAEVRAKTNSEQIRGSRIDAEIAASDLVIEAVIERLPVKQRILSRLESLAAAETILASNTSSLSITRIAGKLSRPEQFLGLHFCHPVAERPLVEVVRGERTSERTIAASCEYVQRIGKLPVVVKDSPGFVVNRLLSLYLNEAMELLLCGASVEAIEVAAMDFGMPVGPLTAIDEIGVDVVLRAGTIISRAFPERIVPAELLVTMFQAGQWGRKAGVGFFRYDESGGEKNVSSVAAEMIQRLSRARTTFSREEITSRLFLPMLVEAGHVLDEELVGEPCEIDLALVHGLGFPETHGGLLGWAGSLGLNAIHKLLHPLRPLGARFRPSARLLARVCDGYGVSSRRVAG